MKFRLTEVAQRDLFEIWAFIALRDQGAADKMERQILEACGRLAERPDLGHFRRDLTVRDLQFFNVRGFCLIVYESESKPLSVIRILHGARDAHAELKSEID